MTGDSPQITPTSAQDRLFSRVTELLAPLGLELVHLEIVNQRQKILRLFIERIEGRVSIDDCVTATKALDEPLEAEATLAEIFKNTPYELEVSSPGLDRPLRQPKDYQKFAGQEVKIHTFRPLNADELGNQAYQAKNPKQRNFIGQLAGLRGETPTGMKVALTVNQDEITIPLPLISKANLEPQFGFGDEQEKRS